MDADPAKKTLIRSFGRRRTKGLRPTRANAMDDVLPRVSIPAGEAVAAPQTFFDFPVKQVWFEIGFGNGEHLLHQAENNPDTGMIGCEPFMNGVSALCVGIQEKSVKNIRIWPEDARLLMARLKPQSIDRLFLLHPDPWPKNRHHKRRFVQTETLDEIARLLKPEAEFRMATDHPELAAWLQEKTGAHLSFKQLVVDRESWPETRYGQKGVHQGRPPTYFRFKRI